MSTIVQVTQISNQVCDIKERVLTAKIQTSSEKTPFVSGAIDVLALPTSMFTANPILNPSIPLMHTIGISLPYEKNNKKRALALVHKDKSIPKNLRLKTGKVKELADGVFVKKRLDGTLEIYISEE